MKKTSCLLIGVIFLFHALKAQKVATLSAGQEKQFYQGYFIHFRVLQNLGYGYDVFYQQKLVIHQYNNPFTLEPIGLRRWDDALKVAKWQISQLKGRPMQHVQVLYNRPVNKQVARQMNILTQ